MTDINSLEDFSLNHSVTMKNLCLSLFFYVASIVYAGVVISNMWSWFIEPATSIPLRIDVAIAIWATFIFINNQIPLANKKLSQNRGGDKKKDLKLSFRKELLLDQKKLLAQFVFRTKMSVYSIVGSTSFLIFCWILKSISSYG